MGNEDNRLGKLFELHDEHTKQLTDLTVGAKVMESKVEAMQKQFHVMNMDNTAQHAKIEAGLKEVSDKVTTLSNYEIARQGAQKITRWVAPIMISVISISVAIAAVVLAS